MKKNILTLTTFILSVFVFAQEADKENWFHKQYEQDGIYGVGSYAAHQYIKEKGLTTSPIIVAVLDSGVDILHEDLKDNIWINEDEIPNNGIDDDKNGYIDDVNGWNFIGNPNGENVDGDNLEVTRLYVKYKAIFDGEDKKQNIINRKRKNDLYLEYLDIKKEFIQNGGDNSGKADEYRNIKKEKLSLLNSVTDILRNKKLTDTDLEEVAKKNKLTNEQIEAIAYIKRLTNGNMLQLKENTLEEFKTTLAAKLDEVIEHFSSENSHYNTELNTREIVGDNYEKVKEKYYGNNNPEGPDALHGTHVSGIISAVKNNDLGMDGIAGNHVKIMSVRTVPDGDERDKDVANAIRYAVDNGAKIINMSFGKGYSPNVKTVWKAIKYAAKKDVLLVHAAGNSNENIDEEFNFPTNYKFKGSVKPVSSTYVTIGASTRNNEALKASFSNFGEVEVDIFAPGLEIYSTTPDNSYKFLQGTSMAAPAFSGCAALLWSLYPNLSAVQVKNILLETANKPTSKGFKELSKTGGIVDIYNAIKFAEKL